MMLAAVPAAVSTYSEKPNRWILDEGSIPSRSTRRVHSIFLMGLIWFRQGY